MTLCSRHSHTNTRARVSGAWGWGECCCLCLVLSQALWGAVEGQHFGLAGVEELDRRTERVWKAWRWTACREKSTLIPGFWWGCCTVGWAVGLKVMTLLPSMEGMCCLPPPHRSSVRAPDMDTASSRGWQGEVPVLRAGPLAGRGQAACADSDISRPGLRAQRLIENSCSFWQAAPGWAAPWLSLGLHLAFAWPGEGCWGREG